VLVDAGCELNMYASDLTRTFPANGKFTDPQRDLYTAVLNAQKECVRRCKVEDGVSMNELHRASKSFRFCIVVSKLIHQVAVYCWRS
jgi:intermediate cleaving peptidase 55